MAFIAPQTVPSTRKPGFARLLAALGAGLERYVEARSRVPEIEALQHKTDAELARMGLTRDGIVRHVFADRLYL